MSDARSVKPALTSEEWTKLESPGNPKFEYGDVQAGAVRLEYVTVDYDDDFNPQTQYLPIVYGESAFRYPIADRHGCAALCLHEQPFGFTREDVHDERQAYHDAVILARHYQDAGMEDARYECIARAARHQRRSDRIAALLPPEDAT